MGASALSWVPVGVSVAPQHDESSRSPGDGPRQPGNGHADVATVLVIEDEVLIRLAVCDHLRHAGYRVIEGSNAEEAQRVFRAGQPIEVLFSDVDLGPGMDGFALAKWVRAEYPAVRILLASGVARVGEQTGGLSDGPFFNKPYSYDSLEDHIRRLLGLFGKRTS
jgi:DNA-binding NtrC family response regulator